MILERIAIRSALGAAGSFIKSIPREVWYAIALFAAWWFVSAHYIGVGEAREKTKWEEEVARITAERDAALLVAEENDAVIQAEGEASITKARKELDDAVKDIPDQKPSERQRARACYELMRQGRRCDVEPASAASASGSAGERPAP